MIPPCCWRSPKNRHFTLMWLQLVNNIFMIIQRKTWKCFQLYLRFFLLFFFAHLVLHESFIRLLTFKINEKMALQTIFSFQFNDTAKCAKKKIFSIYLWVGMLIWWQHGILKLNWCGKKGVKQRDAIIRACKFELPIIIYYNYQL